MSEHEGGRRPTHFDPKGLGENLKEVAVDYLEVDARKVTSRWYHGGRDTDLYVWTDENAEVIKQQMSFYGQIVEWNILDGVRTGLLIEEDVAEELESRSENIKFDRTPHQAAVQQAVQVLKFIRGIKGSDLERLINNFENGALRDVSRILEARRNVRNPIIWLWLTVLHKIRKFFS